MLQAITVTYLGPTNYKPSRLVARAQAGRLVVSWDHVLSREENYARAARRLAERLGWDGAWVGGWDHDDRCVFVQRPRYYETASVFVVTPVADPVAKT